MATSSVCSVSSSDSTGRCATHPAAFNKASGPPSDANGETQSSFPLKLHAMLEDAHRRGFSDVVSWHESGKSFKVHQPEEYATRIMRSYFNQTKYKSFQRQLNLYGFRRIHHGPGKGGYAHKYFVRGQPHLTQAMTRQRVSRGAATGAAPSTMPASASKTAIHQKQMQGQQPQSQQQRPKGPVDVTTTPLRMTPMKSTEDNRELELFSEFFQGGPDSQLFNDGFDHPRRNSYGQSHHHTGSHHQHNQSQSRHHHHRYHPSQMSSNFSLSAPEYDALFRSIRNDPRNTSSLSGIEYDALFRSMMNDSFVQPDVDEGQYSDASTAKENIGMMEESSLPLEDDEDANKPHSFPWKLHEMLQDADRNKFTQVVSWQLDGTAFKVHNHGEFLRTIMPQYFDQWKRQLRVASSTVPESLLYMTSLKTKDV